MQLIIRKAQRTLELVKQNETVLACRVALGREPVGAKRMECDGKTPEGLYTICLVKEEGKYGRSLGVSYPNLQDAQAAFAEGRIDERTLANVQAACEERRRPPWGSPLGGEIYIHEGGADRDWTQGCIALETQDMDALFPYWPQVQQVLILP